MHGGDERLHTVTVHLVNKQECDGAADAVCLGDAVEEHKYKVLVIRACPFFSLARSNMLY